MEYQNVNDYSGKNMYGKYAGLEYDYEVPDNLVVSSPGGVSSTHHRPEKGFYGENSGEYDFYAGQGFRYPHGEYGNLYNVGENAPHAMGYFLPPPDPKFYNNKSLKKREDFELIDQPQKESNVDELFEVHQKKGKINLQINPFALFLMFVVAYVALDFWAASGHLFIKEKIHKGNDITWRGTLFYAVVFTAILVGLAVFFKIPFITFETL